MKKRLSFRTFIREHRMEIDDYIRRRTHDPTRINDDEERRQWVLNEEPLYRWAQSLGVNI